MEDYLDPIPEFFPWKDIPTETSAESERRNRREEYLKANEEEVLREGKVAQYRFDTDMQDRKNGFRKTLEDIRKLYTTTAQIPAEEAI